MYSERDFLILRAITTFNVQFDRELDYKKCEIISIDSDGVSDRGYEITSPEVSSTFRIRYYFKFGDYDFMGQFTLESNPQYQEGELGDEVYIIRGVVDRNWKWIAGYKFDPLVIEDIPDWVMITEDGVPMTTESSVFMVVEEASRVETPLQPHPSDTGVYTVT